MGSNTPNLSLYKPADGEDDWAADVNGNFETLDDSVLQEVLTLTSGTTLGANDVALCDASGGGFTVTLPAPSKDIRVSVKKIDSSGNGVTIATPGSETIDGVSSKTISSQYISRTIVSDGTDYFIL